MACTIVKYLFLYFVCLDGLRHESNVFGIKIIESQEDVDSSSNSCRFPGSPAHSSVVFSDETLGPGTIATYKCERGFELLGPSRRVCHDGGIWLPEGIPFCVLNVAAGKAPMQISTEEGGLPQKAIDGSTSSFYTSDTCTLTKMERIPWWYVNLLEPYMVQLVRLDFGKSCCGSNKPATIVVRVGNNRPDLGTNPICNRFTGFIEEGQPLFLPCNPPMPGAFVSVHLEVSTPTQLSICETFVYTDQALPIERCPQFRDQPPGSTATYNGKCYIFYNRQPLKFRDALAFCKSRGGTLVDESNPALQGFISWELWRRHRSDTNSQYWMGAVRDPQERANWKWINGEDVTVSFWNLPGGNEDCARYDGSKGWLWSDTNCNLNLNYICQHQPKACGRPEQPPNSTMLAENYNVGSVIEYSCDEGHLLVGPTTRTCLETGFYNEFPPVCKHIQCGYPADIANGQYQLINGTVGYLSHVIYECDEGFEMVGRAQLICDIDERWNGPPPRCEPIECDDPIPIANGRFTISNNRTVVGTIIEYFCSKGYKLIGSKQIICQANGQYDDRPPTCKEEPSTTRIPTSASTTTTSRRPTRPSSTSTTRQRPKPTKPTPFSTLPTQKPIPPSPTETNNTVSIITSSSESHPGRVREDKSPYRRKTTTPATPTARSTHIPHLIVVNRPQENEVYNSASGRQDESVNVNIPQSIDGVSDRRGETYAARLNLGAIIALGAFGGFIFLAAIITTFVILIRRNQSAKHYRHRVSPDCNTVASFDSSSSESRNGLNRYYRQAWENLHESAGNKTGLKASSTNHSPLNRKETLEDPHFHKERHRDASGELMVADITSPTTANGGLRATANGGGNEKKRHHHHHHHHHEGRGSGGVSGNHKDWGMSKNTSHHREQNHSRKY